MRIMMISPIQIAKTTRNARDISELVWVDVDV